MSSVNSRSTSGQDETARKAREDYRKKEADLVNKHAQEIRKLNETYANEISRMQKAHADRISNMRDRSVESLTEKDVKYQKEIEELRKMHHQQIKKLMQDSQAQVKAQNRAAKQEIKHANLGRNDRTDELHDRYNRQVAEINDRYAKEIEELRQSQQDTIERKEAKLRESHEEEIDHLRDERNETVARLRNDFRQLKQGSNERLRAQEVRHMQDKARMSDSFMDAINHERREHNEIQDISRKGYSHNLEKLRDKFAKEQEADRERQDMMRKDLKSDIDDRVTTQVNRLKRDLGKAKNQVVRADRDAQFKSQREIENIREAYQANIDILERDRKAILEQQNDVNAKDIRRVRAEADNQMNENTRFFLDRMNVENLKNRQAYDSMEKEYQMREQFQKENANKRVENIVAASIEKEEDLRENFDANVNVLREGYEQEKREIRLAANKEKVQAVQQLKEQAQKQELDHARRTADLVAKYEKRIQEMNDQLVREKRIRDHRERQLVRDLKRQIDAEKETLKIQYEEKNKQAQAAHEREKREIARRQSEKLDEVLRARKKT